MNLVIILALLFDILVLVKLSMRVATCGDIVCLLITPVFFWPGAIVRGFENLRRFGVWLWQQRHWRPRGSWRTTTLGVTAILIGLRSAAVVWVPTQTIYFNVFYVLPGPLALIIVGWALIHARDHKHRD